jgi:hypothetical protein
VSWAALLTIAAGAYAFKAVGVFVFGRLTVSPAFLAIGGLLPPALLAALIMIQTVSSESSLVLDARAAGVAAGALAAWRNAPFWLVATLAAVVTALIRAT